MYNEISILGLELSMRNGMHKSKFCIHVVLNVFSYTIFSCLCILELKLHPVYNEISKGHN